MFAFFDRDVLRTRFANLAPGFDETGFLRQLARFAVVEDQEVDARQERIEIGARRLDPQIHCVGHHETRALHLVQHVGLQRRRDVRQ